ncbi:MAG: cytochrome c biogenesis protein CcsA [Rikenellaceae bacterium]|nr:cytochrome c biogenesis protein CcsA [Rikenellaceae bacterium]
MVGWNLFAWFAVAAMVLSVVAAVAAWGDKRRVALACAVLGVAALATFVALFWTTLGRPPLRTMGETRLWYSLCLLVAGAFTYWRWRYRWILSFSTLLASVFMIINIARPEIHDQTLMPALQSGWFVPHVAVYMFSYALLGCATLMAIYGLFRKDRDLTQAIDRLMYGGVAFFTIGMLTGALWAKQAWGAYWSWDAKEAWAAATWALYLLAIHMWGRGRRFVAVVVVAFLALQMCWYGVNYLPSAEQSVHTYNQN